MIVLADFSNPREKFVYDGTVRKVKLEKFDNSLDQGIANMVEQGVIIGLFIDKEQLYLLLNEQVINIIEKKLECSNTPLMNNEREFILKIDGQLVYRQRYTRPCTELDLIYGEDERLTDFLYMVSDTLNDSKEINNIITRYSRQR